MNQVTETDLRRVEDKIDELADNMLKLSETISNNHKAVEDRFNQLEKHQQKLEGEFKNLETKIDGQINTLTETVKGIDKRLEGIEALSRIVSGGFIVGILLALAKYLFFSSSNV